MEKIDPATLATVVDDRFFETFIRTYVRNRLADAIGQNGLSESNYSTFVTYTQSSKKASWNVYLSKDYLDESVKEADSLVGGLYEGLRRLDFRTGQTRFLCLAEREDGEDD